MSTFERLLTSKPVDRLAARQLSRGIEWRPNFAGNPHARKWSDKPTDWLIPIPKDGHRGSFEDMTGRTLGRFTVVGWLGKPNRKTKSVWLVRCTCGNYETRGARAIKGGWPHDACEQCKYLEKVKRGAGNTPLADRDSGRPPKGEDARSAAECEASQSGPKGIAQ